ncbi:conserved Plasmodium protein, unknown function [Plasmodium vivax]|uniref:Uncharacterized protein n=7 Tax=Plasmodium vivax TaxID=5855 RepID=A5K8C6_PLAVS|nr:hypothetical protein, conserved [Plasmodium vivax]KMZ79179.1 hypothetical protein PVIIG_01653 [Plasmodium vivax India VII]KMZ85324.1 hypothetical protein PVBG_02010 [Plasmodium vivax Brazil I]KMZ91201.1 hypothetical protein PVMG_00075 [Plasmodium vivax Mauritania I]KMZ98390.1 hypothetical protein PVNG_05732 [Plasmodium vivax North Korean]EDL44540.1 hypothetical protein, conserved [Plasmodium vivax]|eukprot:XP_001614267.1 hypothetical protein [Plasmodium vivax Sal-1]
MEDKKTDPSNRTKENVKFSKFVTSLSFMKKNTNDKEEGIKKKVKYANDEHVWILKEYEEEGNAFLKKQAAQKNKNNVALNCLGRRSYKNYNSYVNLYNMEIKKFINSVRKNKPVGSLRE